MISTILVAIDEAWFDDDMVTFAAELGGSLGASLIVMDVSGHMLRPAAPDGGPSAPISRTHRTIERLRAVGLQARGPADREQPQCGASPIVDAAAAEGADLIILGPHGCSDAEGAVLGSVSQDVLQLSDVPVAIVRAGGVNGSAQRPRLGWRGVLTTRTDGLVAARVTRARHEEA